MILKINKNKYHCGNFFLSRAEIQGLHPVQANLRHFLAWFQSVQRPSTWPESPLPLIPEANESNVSFKACSQLWIEIFIFWTVLSITGLTKVYCKWKWYLSESILHQCNGICRLDFPDIQSTVYNQSKQRTEVACLPVGVGLVTVSLRPAAVPADAAL